MHWKFPEVLETLQCSEFFFLIIQKHSRMFGKISDFLKLSRVSETETLHIVRKLSKVSENLPEIPETFKRFRKLSRDSRNLPEISETFQNFRKLSRVSENFQEVLETFHNVH